MEQPWVTVEQARSVTSAHVVIHALQSEGIEARLIGEHRPSIAGELPLPEAMVEIRVRQEDARRATELIAALMAASADEAPTRCPSCGEENPGNFGACWKCDAPLGE